MVLPTAPRTHPREGAVVAPGEPGSTAGNSRAVSHVEVALGACEGAALWSGERVSVGEKVAAGGAEPAEDLGEGWDALFGESSGSVADVSGGSHSEDDEDYDPVQVSVDPETGERVVTYIPRGAGTRVDADVYAEFFAEQEARAEAARLAAEEAESEEIEAERIALEQHNSRVIEDVVSHEALAPVRARISLPERRFGIALGCLVSAVLAVALVVGIRTFTPTEESEPTPTPSTIFQVDPDALG